MAELTGRLHRLLLTQAGGGFSGFFDVYQLGGHVRIRATNNHLTTAIMKCHGLLWATAT